MKNRESVKSMAIRPQYESLGVKGYYSGHGAEYRNPHEPAIREIIALALERWRPDLSNVLDLACGSGEATLALIDNSPRQIKIAGIDPYTSEAYRKRTGLEAERLSFEQIAGGALSGRLYSLVVCSFALHLIDSSWLPSLLAQIAMVTDNFWVVTPHKRPEFRVDWGWELADEISHRRIRIRKYVSKK